MHSMAPIAHEKRTPVTRDRFFPAVDYAGELLFRKFVGNSVAFGPRSGSDPCDQSIADYGRFDCESGPGPGFEFSVRT